MILSLDGKAPRLHPNTFLAAGAQVIGDVSVGEYSSIWFNAVVRGDEARIALGRYVNIQDGSVLHVDAGFPLLVGDYVTVGHRAILHSCTIGQGSMVGMGAILLTGAVMEDESLLAAGSLVPEGRTIPARVLAMGSPAKVVRELTVQEVEKLRRWAHDYAEKWLHCYRPIHNLTEHGGD